jgi:uncharacterized protein YdeI (YjbR/CyaY-like superfamily)
MQETFKGKKTFYAKTRKDWRKWLEKNSETEKSVWLISYNKKSDLKSVPYEELVEEGLCFGWIDSVKYKRDDESSYQYFSPRKPKSNWSKSNRDRVKKLTEAGLMTASGQKLIDHAKKSGTWNALVQVENSVIPDDLQKLFNKNKTAQKYFSAFSSSAKRMILEWILSAKRPETRANRIEETVRLASKNLKSR